MDKVHGAPKVKKSTMISEEHNVTVPSNLGTGNSSLGGERRKVGTATFTIN